MDGRRLLSVGLIALLVCATALASVLVLRSEQADERARATAVASEAAASLTAALRRTELALTDVGGLDRAGDVSAQAFAALAAAAQGDRTTTLVGWAPRVRAADRRAFERRLGRSMTAPSPDGALRRQGDAAEYLPFLRIAPPTASNRRKRGLNQLAEPALARAVRAARDAGRPRLTAPAMFLASDPLAVTMYRPLYAAGAPVTTARQRRRAFRGVLAAELSAERLRARVVNDLPKGTSLSVRDGETVLIAGPETARVTRTVAAYGRRWTLYVGPGQSSGYTVPLLIAVVGGLLALGVGVALAVAPRRRARSSVAGHAPAQPVADPDTLLLDVGLVVDGEATMADRTRAVARLLATRGADLCLIDHLDEARGLRRLATAGATPEIAEIAERLGHPAASSGQAQVIKSGEPIVVPEITDEMVVRACATDEGLAAGRELDVRSTMVLPLAAQGVVTGALTLGRRDGSPPFTDADLSFGAQLAQRVSLVLDNARLYETEHEIATTLQEALLPARLDTPPGLDVAVRYRPAGSGVMVGGDFYDVISGAQGWVAVVGDVRGKGPRAAAVTAIVRHTLRARLATDGIADAIAAVNAALIAEHDDELFCSLAAIEIDLDGARPRSGQVRVAVAGHPPPVLLRADGTLGPLEASGRLLGPFDDPHLQIAELALEPGDTLLLVTDGVTEARRNGDQFGVERLQSAVTAAPRGALQGLLTHVELEAVRFAEGQPQDDIALLGVRMPGVGGMTGRQLGDGWARD